MKRRKNIDSYDPQIYPRKLWVAVDCSNIHEYFKIVTTDGSKVLDDEEAEQELLDPQISMGTYSVIDKETSMIGALVYIPDLDRIADTDVSHEAVHVADYVFQELDINAEEFSRGNEAYAYLVGWVAGCISKSLIKVKKDDSRRE